jgi:pimeloyl-ACP methyl ester carboxylesterase
LISAAHKKDRVAAVVSRGGRPDLADPFLELVEAPTLLIVGGDDHVVMGMNEEAASRMIAQHEIVIVPGATHLFEEPGKLEEVAHYACDWFSEYLQ